MTKEIIKGSEYSDQLDGSSVCSHLAPIERFLKAQGWKPLQPRLEHEPKGPWIRRMDTAIPIDVVESHFILPKQILIDKERAGLFCNWCWCDLVGPDLGD